MKKQENMAQTNEQSKSPETDPNKRETYELPKKELKVMVIKKFSALQENTNRQLNKIRKTMHKQNENITNEKETRKIAKQKLSS